MREPRKYKTRAEADNDSRPQTGGDWAFIFGVILLIAMVVAWTIASLAMTS